MNTINKDLILREKLALQRTTLANQSTFLSFLRTSMYFLIAGLSMKSILKLDNSIFFEFTFFAISFFILAIGIVNYFIQHKKIKQSENQVGNFKAEFLNK